jgi:hypothetical protein
MANIGAQLERLEKEGKIVFELLPHWEMTPAEVWQHFMPGIEPEDAYRQLSRQLPGLQLTLAPDSQEVVTLISSIKDVPGYLYGNFIYNREEGTLSVGSVDVSPKMQGRGTARQLLGNLMDVVESGMEANPLTITATDVGSYTWARMGFAAEEGEWSKLQKPVLKRWKQLRPHIPEKDACLVDAMLKEKNPESTRDLIWAISDLAFPTPGTEKPSALGKDLLVGLGWKGELDRNDMDAMDRFNTYTLRHRHTVLPFDPSSSLATESFRR